MPSLTDVVSLGKEFRAKNANLKKLDKFIIEYNQPYLTFGQFITLQFNKRSPEKQIFLSAFYNKNWTARSHNYLKISYVEKEILRRMADPEVKFIFKGVRKPYRWYVKK